MATTQVKDVVAVYTQGFVQGFVQVFMRARPVRANIREYSRVMEHPLETGAVITDHRIVMPTEIQLDLLLQSEDYLEAYREIKQCFLNGTLLVVQTKSGSYPNQLIVEFPHEENPEIYDALSVGLKLKQSLFAGSSFSVNPAAPPNQSTVQRGQQSGTTLPNNSSSVLNAFPKLRNV